MTGAATFYNSTGRNGARRLHLKLYTKTGDDGQTGLVGGARVSKDDLRVVAYGEVDAANSALGSAIAACDDGEAKSRLRRGSWVATTCAAAARRGGIEP